jgi:ribosomal protein L23
MSAAQFDEGRLMQVLVAPIVSEKATMVPKTNAVLFKVLRDATKPEIKAAVEMMFKVRSKACPCSTKRASPSASARPLVAVTTCAKPT